MRTKREERILEKFFHEVLYLQAKRKGSNKEQVKNEADIINMNVLIAAAEKVGHRMSTEEFQGVCAAVGVKAGKELEVVIEVTVNLCILYKT